MHHPKTLARAAVRYFAANLAVIALAGCSEKKAVTYQGYVEGEFVYVASAEAGRLDRLLVARGQQVAAGAPLFALESAHETGAVRQARQQLNSAEAQLADLLTGKRQPELEVVRAQLAQAETKAGNSMATRVRNEAQGAAGGIAMATVEDSRAEAEADAGHVRELRGQVAVAGLPARGEQIRAQTANVAAAQAFLDQARWTLGQKVVAASAAGLVFDTIYREGEWVPAGAPIVRMLPPENVKVRFFVPEPLLGGLSIGQEVVLRRDGAPAEMRAKVTYISAESEYTPPVIYSNETRSKLVFMIEARPDPAQTHNLHPGQPVVVTLR
ncbi:MAG: HlyD family efflux transporter periplasmic adaptor subunit [Holophaga sp.]|jgi:HlyD family secretion protein